jgi:type 1 fimbriae regulatory protein FimB/type 1 fimbriae regulatory protein FimE
VTEAEVEALMSAAKANRQDHRDATMLLVAYRHGLRASEVCDLRWDQVDFIAAVLVIFTAMIGDRETCRGNTPPRWMDTRRAEQRNRSRRWRFT